MVQTVCGTAGCIFVSLCVKRRDDTCHLGTVVFLGGRFLECADVNGSIKVGWEGG